MQPTAARYTEAARQRALHARVRQVIWHLERYVHGPPHSPRGPKSRGAKTRALLEDPTLKIKGGSRLAAMLAVPHELEPDDDDPELRAGTRGPTFFGPFMAIAAEETLPNAYGRYVDFSRGGFVAIDVDTFDD